MASHPRASRRRRVLLAALGLGLLLGVLGPSLLRLHARRTVETRLEEALGGRAQVGRVETLRPRLLVLRDVTVEGLSQVPLIERLRAERVALRAPSWRAGLSGRHDDMLIEGLELVTGEVPPTSTSPAKAAPPTAWPTARIALAGGIVRVPGRDATARLLFEGELSVSPRGPMGQLRFSAGRLPVEPFASLVSLNGPELMGPFVSSLRLEAVTGLVDLQETRSFLELRALGGALGVQGTPRSITSLEARADLGFDGAATLRAQANAPWAGELGLSALRSPGKGWRLQSARAVGLDAAFLEGLHPALGNWRLSGATDLSLTQQVGEGPLGLAIDARLESAEGPWGSGKLRVEEAWLQAEAASGGELLALTLRSARLGAASWRWCSPSSASTATGEIFAAELSGRFDAASARFEASEVKASLASLRLNRGEKQQAAVEGLDLRAARGSFDFGGETSSSAEDVAVSAKRAEFRSEPARTLQLESIEIAGAISSAPMAAGSAVSATLDAGAILGEGLGRLDVQGALGEAWDLSWSWQPEDAARVVAAFFAESPRKPTIESMSASGRITGPLAFPRATARLEAGALSWNAADGLSLELSSGLADLSWTLGEEALAFALPPLPCEFTLESSVVALELSARGRWPLGSPASLPFFDRFEIDAERLGRLSASSTGVGDGGRLEISDAALAAWAEFLSGSLPSFWPAHVDGRIEGSLAWTKRAAAPLRLTGGLVLSAAGFESEDGSRILQGAGGHFDLQAHWNPAEEDLALAVKSRDFGGFELAWGTLYGDWSSKQAAVDFTWQAAPGAQEHGETRLSIELDPTSRLSLLLSDAGRKGRLDAVFGDLSSTWTDWLVGPLEGAGPLGALRPAGAAELQLAFESAESSRSLSGRLRLTGVDASGERPELRVEGLSLDLPIALTLSGSGQARRVEGPPDTGSLAFASLSVGRVALASFDGRLGVEGDSLSLSESLEAPLFSGRLVARELEVSGLLSGRPRLEGRLDLRDLDLHLAAGELGFPPLEGRLDADFADLTLTPSELSLRGRASAQVFGGVVETEEIVISDPFARTPQTRISLVARELDLSRLTSQVGFGVITGRLDGRIDDLVLQAARPVGFSARFETVELPGLPQTVSVQAAENITALGSGGSAGIFDRSLLRYFDHYRYARAGFEADLEHGIIRLRGIERRGARELFVKGRAPLRLDVVNADPERLLSYQGLLERMNKLNLEGVQIETGSPAADHRTER